MTTPPPERTEKTHRRWRTATLAIVAAVTSVAAVLVAVLLTTIMRRQDEARNPFYRVVAITDTTEDPAIWGKNFPQQYDGYMRTVDQVRTRYGGSEAEPHTPTSADPRSLVAQSRLDEDPRLIEFWKGYAFSKDFREERGHAFMLADQEFTARQQAAKQPGTCLHCHGSMVVPYMRAGHGDLTKGFEALNPMPYAKARELVKHPVSCIDCHNPSTMALRVTRPGFIEGIRALKASQGVENAASYDPNTMATRQDMRTFVCAQCHVEYHFTGPEKRLVYPWAKGLTVDSILAFYDSTNHSDWTHALSGAKVLKAQHPEFELYSQGIHARAGVACADCHMPYERVGAMKISDHHVRSPVLNINRACQTCHKVSEAELKGRVEASQSRTYELRNVALDAVLQLTRGIAAVAARDSGDSRLTTARDFQRRAQFFTDFVEAENSMGFHAPQEAVRILGRAIDYARRGEIALRAADIPLATPRRRGGQ